MDVHAVSPGLLQIDFIYPSGTPNPGRGRSVEAGVGINSAWFAGFPPLQIIWSTSNSKFTSVRAKMLVPVGQEQEFVANIKAQLKRFAAVG